MPTTLPDFRRFEIVSGGTDPLTGINRTKFGSKSILINNRYSHYGEDICDSLYRDVNKLVKRFKVTEENREFTVWYAVVFESPSGHSNTQPYFSITCDLAPGSDLCFDASQLDCTQNLTDEICGSTSVDVVNWTCHRIKIPQNQVGSIATLEISVADCGLHAHFGYAYVDGICEVCTGSALGSITLYDQPWNDSVGNFYRSCSGDTIRICGTYTLPNICGTWVVDSINVPGFIIHNLDIDTANKSFCFELDISQFPEDSCRELFAMIYFRSNTSKHSDVISNTIEICDSDFLEYLTTVTISSCYDNNTDEFISDDFYFVYATVNVNYGEAWTMDKNLLDPYPDELGKFEIKTGNGSGVVNLGPFLIQEGSWELIIHYGGCSDTIIIDPPDFCPECENFLGLKLLNVSCIDPEPINNPDDPTDDTWTFDVDVTLLGNSGNFKLYIASTPPTFVGTYGYNDDHTIQAGLISNGCITYSINDEFETSCKIVFTICPPKPCSSGSDCDLELYVKEYICDDGEFSVEIDVQNYNSANLCYRVQGSGNPQGSLTSFLLGPYTENIYLTVYLCNTPTCYKRIFIPLLDCDEEDFQGGDGSSRGSSILNHSELRIIPNPIKNGEINIESKLNQTDFEIYNATNQLIHKASFLGPYYRFSADLSPGVYFLNYKNAQGKFITEKFIRQ
ncbi:MAG: T9SS type A sorting domain-containing protein [Saprospiraceae bacterium]|nr:T9SS type A sorting domain-containing protein [Saprospiraceae bacterium]